MTDRSDEMKSDSELEITEPDTGYPTTNSITIRPSHTYISTNTDKGKLDRKNKQSNIS